MSMEFIDSKQDRWHLAGDEDGSLPSSAPVAYLLLTLAQWQTVRDAWPAGLNTGVIVPNDSDIEALSVDLAKLSALILQFPKWTDGRAYSQARLLRSRYRYKGQIRASGEVLADMLPLLERTGFDAVQLRSDQSVETARRALDFFAGHYQGDVANPQPWFARQAPVRT